MGFLDKAVERVGATFNYLVRAPQVGLLKDDTIIYRSLRQVLGEAANKVNFPYKQSVWTYSCINAIADNLARVPFVLKKDNGPGKEPTIIEEGALYDVFQNPNPYMTQEELIRATMIFLGLRGESIWILDGRENVTQIPQQIWCFDPHRFEPYFDPKTKYHVGWVYKKGTPQQEFFAMSEIIFFRYFNPYDDIRGMPPLDAAKVSIDQDFLANLYNTTFFENGAEPGGVLAVDGELTDTQYNRALKQFEERHKGPRKGHRIALIEGGAKYYEAKITQRDMQFIEGKKLSREEIMAAYKVNEVVLGIYKDIKSFEGIKSAHKAFWEECEMPKVKYIENLLWSKFFSKLGIRRGRGKIWGEFDLATVGPLQVNYAEQIEIAHRMWSMGWPINEINKRLQLGMQEVPWGNEWWVPGGFLPVTAIMEFTKNGGNAGKQPTNSGEVQGQTPAKKPPKENPAEPNAKPKKEIGTDDRITIECDDEQRRNVLLGVNVEELLLPLEKNFRSKTKRYLFEQRKKVLAKIYEHTPGTELSVVFEKQKESGKLAGAFRQLYVEALGAGYSTFCTQMGSTSPFPSTQGVGPVNTYVETKASFMSKNFMDMTESLIDALTNYINTQHPTNEEAANKAREIYNLLSGKCSLLSNKEAYIAYAYGRVLAIQQHGTEQHKKFLDPFIKDFGASLGNKRLEEKNDG
jgi:HK97 family phage portal protein